MVCLPPSAADSACVLVLHGLTNCRQRCCKVLSEPFITVHNLTLFVQHRNNISMGKASLTVLLYLTPSSTASSKMASE